MKKSKLLKTLAVFAISAGAAIGCFAMAACTKKPDNSGNTDQTQTGGDEENKKPDEGNTTNPPANVEYETTATYTWSANDAFTEAKDGIATDIVLVDGVATVLANIDGQTGGELQVKANGSGWKLNLKGQGTTKGRWIKLELEGAAKIVITMRNGSSGKGDCKVNVCTALDHGTKIADKGFTLVDGGSMEEVTVTLAAGTYYIGSENYKNESGADMKPTIEINALSIFYAKA